ncbi:ribonucleoside-triphosphate reductase class III activase subunit [Desulforamulus reducens MI-1]|uniref:Anaerobic ribonucleoside-triphosphate reductase-activating protein n=1 Tax=Desulforamulus reducens (strain ATCC BAA-1160 / DSM 100696 / MI-1) TaxID=349161 RepID=A4J2D0_DESRM|nr:anaerobic ribonucleoside-triphosphate reductase activating protein [Desulforamulus reducens]ABO49233.1 ribonucleoside-triphosphate reductase class III activase subunit [Desulforamulus reducens MI-1]
MSLTLRLGGITANSVVDGPGLRIVVFLQGCPRYCPGCHNEELLEPEGGREITTEEAIEEIKATISPLTQGITFSGGDPLMQPQALQFLVKRVRQEFPRLDIWVYTGYRYEEVKDLPVLEQVDVLVDGPFLQEQRDLDLVFRGSGNQRLIDVPKTRQTGQVVEWQQPVW